MVTDPHRFEWHLVQVGKHPPVHVLRNWSNGHWLALLYHLKGQPRLRVYLPGSQWEDRDASQVEPVRVPPGFWDDGPSDERVRGLLSWLQATTGLPDSFLDIRPFHGHRVNVQGIPFYSYEMAEKEGMALAFSRIRAGLPASMVKPFSDELRRIRHLRTLPQRKRWDDAYPKDATQLGRLLEDKSRDIDASCADCRRVTLVGDRAGTRRFNQTRSCCGSHEWEVTLGWIPFLSAGRRYRLGFNYGH